MCSFSFRSIGALVGALSIVSSLTGCVGDATDSPLNIQSNQELDSAEPMIVITGYTMDVGENIIANAWLTLVNTTTQEVVAETQSDHNGAFELTIDIEADVTLFAALQEEDVLLIAVEDFNIDSPSTDLEFYMILTELVMDENCQDPASEGAPPPACYRYVASYNYSLCWLTHRFYAYMCSTCWPYSCSWITVGSC